MDVLIITVFLIRVGRFDRFNYTTKTGLNVFTFITSKVEYIKLLYLKFSLKKRNISLLFKFIKNYGFINITVLYFCDKQTRNHRGSPCL